MASTRLAIPVRIERLKASLRAHVRTQNIRTALQACIDLPNELVDMIMDYVFEAVHERLRSQWRIIYLCSVGENRGTLGAIYRRVCERFDTSELAEAQYHQLKRCDACSDNASQQHSDFYQMMPDKLYDDEVEREWLKVRQHCEDCQAMVDEKYEPTTAQVWNSEGYEDSIIDLDNAHDSHPVVWLLQSLYPSYANNAWLLASHSLVDDWNTAIRDGFFSQQETTILSELNVKCEILPRARADNAFTNVELVVSQSQPTDNTPVETSLTDAQKTFHRALKYLHLKPSLYHRSPRRPWWGQQNPFWRSQTLR